MKPIKLARMNPEQVANEIGDFLVNRVAGIGFTGGVIGLSGGVDSTVVAALTKRAFDRYNAINNNRIELVGYALPSKTNSPKDAEDGIYVAEKLGIRYEVRNIEPLVEAYEKVSPAVMGNLFNKGNLMSEIRATVLHGEAALGKKLVIGTGNRDEDFGVGYYTLFGDGAVHLSPIGNLSKRLVREMANYLGFENLANRVPTAGLEPGQTDFGDLGYSYSFVELLSEGVLQGFGGLELALHPQVVEMGNNEIVEYQKMYGKKKFERVESMVTDFYKRNNIADAKAKIVSPAIAEVSLYYSEGGEMTLEKNDKLIYEGHLKLVQRLHEGRLYDVVVSKDAAIMLYIDERDMVHLTKQYRPAMGKEMIALPAETLDKLHLSPLETMVEGLEEECGIRINENQVKYVGKHCSSDGHDTEFVYLFLAHGAGEYVGQRLEDSEKIETMKVPFDEVYQMVLDNEIEGAKTSYLVTYEKLRRLNELK